MPDYSKLQRDIAREILKQEGRITADTAAFVDEFVKQLQAKGWKITRDEQQALSDWLASIRDSLTAAITSALSVAASQGVLSDAAITSMTEAAFAQKWPDGLNLSDRLWQWDKTMRQGLADVLKKAIKHNQSVSKTMYDMQKAIERNRGGQLFKIVSDNQDDWVKDLFKAGQDLINNPAAKTAWDKVVAETQDRIDNLARTGTKTAAEQVLKSMQAAVAKGSEALLDNAAKWWLYDKQLYQLKRIVRTEMADAGHQAIIDSSIDDDLIIGFLWELSSSHPVTDICDYYAGVDFGLGRGVWPKDKVPRHKAHPHCMCIITPRVTNVKQRGGKNFMDVIKKLPPAEVAKMLPKWALDKYNAGEDLTKYLRKDGAWLITKEEAEKMAK
jgi:hypothetical protein